MLYSTIMKILLVSAVIDLVVIHEDEVSGTLFRRQVVVFVGADYVDECVPDESWEFIDFGAREDFWLHLMIMCVWL